MNNLRTNYVTVIPDIVPVVTILAWLLVLAVFMIVPMLIIQGIEDRSAAPAIQLRLLALQKSHTSNQQNQRTDIDVRDIDAVRVALKRLDRIEGARGGRVRAVFGMLEMALPPEATLKTLRYRAAAGQWHLEVLAQSEAALSRFQDRLEEEGYFRNVLLRTRATERGGFVRYEIMLEEQG